MQTLEKPQIVPAPDVHPAQPAPFLVLGGTPPVIPGVVLGGTAGAPCGAIILLGHVDPGELTTTLAQTPDPAVPIADFGNNFMLRRDYSGINFNAATVRDFQQCFAPIWRRLAALPFRVEPQSRAELTLLRLAYSRDSVIEAAFRPDSRRLVEYPLLGGAAPERPRLEALAHLELLHRRHFTRTHACAKCRSARLHAYEACPKCGSADLREATLVHHYRCGYQDVEQRFDQGEFLICPKCHRALHHLGVDYGKPGKAVVCGSCSATNSEPAVHFACMDCGTITPSDEAVATDWFHYDLTSDALLALRSGHLPQFDIAPLLESRTHAYSARDFRLLATHEMQVSQRFKRPFSVARFTVRNLDVALAKRGPVAVEASFRRVIAAVVAGLRTTDFVGVGSMTSVVIGFPGASISELDAIIDRVQRTVQATATMYVDLGIETAEGDDIVDLLAKG